MTRIEVVVRLFGGGEGGACSLPSSVDVANSLAFSGCGGSKLELFISTIRTSFAPKVPNLLLGATEYGNYCLALLYTRWESVVMPPNLY